jgi:dipeptidyl aminopeptidase/acylaminoacyl peptidase
VLLAHDENPNFLSSEQARKLAAALKKQGTPVEAVPLKYTNYDPRGREAELDLYHRIEVFLAQNLLTPGK